MRLGAARRRETILAAATDVFAELGYRRGTVSTIAARIGVSEPVVFQNFGTKAALFHAVLDQLASTMCATLTDHAAHAGTVPELLAALVSPAHVEVLHAPGSPGALFAEAASLTAEPDVGTAARDAIHRVATTLADLLARGQRAGDIRADVDPVAGAWWLLSLMAARPFRTAIATDPTGVEDQLAAMTVTLLSTPHS